MMQIRYGQTILFIGDSITDAERNRQDFYDLGTGYPMLISAYLSEQYPNSHLKILNRGISGNKIDELKARWEKDCIDLTPDIVSILIGINDIWHFIDHEQMLTPERLEQFEQDYRDILKETREKLNTQIVLIEPYVLPYPSDRWNWRKHLDPRIQVVRKLAEEFEAELIPLDGILNALGIQNGFAYYTGEDGVHPTLAGHAAIAKAWLDRAEKTS